MTSRIIKFRIIDIYKATWTNSYGWELQDHDLRTIVNQGN